jgi:uncharacterized protein YndB with AHSA1/START domain
MTGITTDHSQMVIETITINAPASKVWQAITEPDLMKKWMSDNEIDISTDWQPGNVMTVSGKKPYPFKNIGFVLKFEPEKTMSYSHLSSISKLPDVPENYTVIAFELTAIADNQTKLSVTTSNFPTASIYHHFAYYWRITIGLLKGFVEATV